MICPKCSHVNTPGAKFCSECGSPLTDSGKIYGLTNHDGEREESATQDGFATSKIPDIIVPPLNAPEDDEASSPYAPSTGLEEFDFDPIDENNEDDPEYGDWGPYGYNLDAPDGITRVIHDTRGIDEFLVEPGYIAPERSWGSGDTMEMPKIEGDEAPKQKEFKAPDAGKKKSKKGRIVISCIIALLILAAIGAGTSYAMEFWGGKTVPDVVGMSKAEAVDELETLGFSVRTSEVKSDDTPDTVLLMDPGAGGRWQSGTEIILHVAVARTMPNVIGKTQEEAEAIFADEGFEQVEYVLEKSNEAEGTVLAADPAADTVVKSTQQITVTVAQPYTVPDVMGKGKDEAIGILNAEGYEATVVYVYSESAEGTVVATDPAAGSKLDSDATVEVQIAKSRGSEIVALTSEYLASLTTLTLGGTTYEVVSVDSAPTYKGDNIAAGSLTVRAVTTLDGETVYGSSKQRSVTVVWSDDNTLESIS